MSKPPKRSNSIEITSETTIDQLRGLEDTSLTHHDLGRTQARRRQDMGRSLNFLNLDRKGHFTADSKTVGGASPRLALMQLRIRRLKKTSPSERLYQSDSALFSSANATEEPHTPKNDVWYKSAYYKAGSTKKNKLSLEKLDEAEQEFEDSQSNFDELNTSGTSLWLFEANQSAPGFLAGEAKISSAGGAIREEDEGESHVRRPVME